MSTNPKSVFSSPTTTRWSAFGIKSLVAATEIEVVAEAATGQAAVKLALAKQLDLMLLDVRMPDGDGLTALGHIGPSNRICRCCSSRCLIISLALWLSGMPVIVNLGRGGEWPPACRCQGRRDIMAV